MPKNISGPTLEDAKAAAKPHLEGVKERLDTVHSSISSAVHTQMILLYNEGYRAGYKARVDELPSEIATSPKAVAAASVKFLVPGLRIHSVDWEPMLQRAFPNAKRGPLKWVTDAFPKGFAAYDINTPLRAAHFLAQVGHESGELRYREEIASGAAYEGRTDLGNTQPGDGRKFKGHGLIQLTGRSNHAAFSEYVNRPDLMNHPDRIVSEPELALGTALWFWGVGNRTGKSLNRYADRDDIRTITRIINGGFNGFEDRKRLLGTAKAALDWAEVMLMQRLLNATLNLELKVDGALGGMTRDAVVDFQKLEGLDVDGIAGPATWAGLLEV